MTLDEIRKSTKDFLSPDDLRGAIPANANNIRAQAHDNPALLGFPAIVVGTRVLIPRLGFLHFIDYGRCAP